MKFQSELLPMYFIVYVWDYDMRTYCFLLCILAKLEKLRETPPSWLLHTEFREFSTWSISWCCMAQYSKKLLMLFFSLKVLYMSIIHIDHTRLPLPPFNPIYSLPFPTSSPLGTKSKASHFRWREILWADEPVSGIASGKHCSSISLFTKWVVCFITILCFLNTQCHIFGFLIFPKVINCLQKGNSPRA